MIAQVRTAAVRLGLRPAHAVLDAPLLAQDGQWLMYSGSYSSHRFSPLTQISTDNVAKLRPPGSISRRHRLGRIARRGRQRRHVRHVGPTSVAALDLKSGKPLWEWTRPIAPSVLNLGFPRVNRGVAILDNMVYVGTLDGYLVALDAKAGIERWSVHVGEKPDRPLPSPPLRSSSTTR
jgi:glucose dehydrogenase